MLVKLKDLIVSSSRLVDRISFKTALIGTLEHPDTAKIYLNNLFPDAKTRITEYRGRPVCGGEGQVYADVLMVKHIEHICAALNIP